MEVAQRTASEHCENDLEVNLKNPVFCQVHAQQRKQQAAHVEENRVEDRTPRPEFSLLEPGVNGAPSLFELRFIHLGVLASVEEQYEEG